MLTKNTMAVIELLIAISYRPATKEDITIFMSANQELAEKIITKLTEAKLIKPSDDTPVKYTLVKPIDKISIFDILKIFKEELIIIGHKDEQVIKTARDSNANVIFTTISVFVSLQLKKISVKDIM